MKEEIVSFFDTEQSKLKSFIFRMTGNIQDSEDILQDTVLTALEKQTQFKSLSNLKTWIYSIASNKTIDFLRKEKRWADNVMDKAKDAAKVDIDFFRSLTTINKSSPHGIFELKEHISLCFDCISKTLTIEQQLALILKDIYEFKVKEIAAVLDKTVSQIKHYLEDSRCKMNQIFDRRCALINKEGVCNQCSELNAIFNPKQDFERKKMELKFNQEKESKTKEELYKLRSELVKSIDPLNSEGHVFQQKHMDFICKISRQR